MRNVLPGHGKGGDCGKTLIKSLSVQFHLGEITPPDCGICWHAVWSRTVWEGNWIRESSSWKPAIQAGFYRRVAAVSLLTDSLYSCCVRTHGYCTENYFCPCTLWGMNSTWPSSDPVAALQTHFFRPHSYLSFVIRIFCGTEMWVSESYKSVLSSWRIQPSWQKSAHTVCKPWLGDVFERWVGRKIGLLFWFSMLVRNKALGTWDRSFNKNKWMRGITTLNMAARCCKKVISTFQHQIGAALFCTSPEQSLSVKD